MATSLKHETAWLDKYMFDDAEAAYYARLAGNAPAASAACVDAAAKKLQALELENSELKQTVRSLVERLGQLEARVSKLETPAGGDKPAAKAAAVKPAQNGAPKKAAKPAADDDDDIDLFGSEEDEEAVKAREQRLKEYDAKKAKKPGPIAKSSVVLEIKPWDDETDMKEMEKCVRSIEMDGLLWGTSKLVPVAFNIKKLQIVCVVEDDKISIEELSEKIEEFEDHVQSVDVAAFNKI